MVLLIRIFYGLIPLFYKIKLRLSQSDITGLSCSWYHTLNIYDTSGPSSQLPFFLQTQTPILILEMTHFGERRSRFYTPNSSCIELIIVIFFIESDLFWILYDNLVSKVLLILIINLSFVESPSLSLVIPCRDVYALLAMKHLHIFLVLSCGKCQLIVWLVLWFEIFPVDFELFDVLWVMTLLIHIHSSNEFNALVVVMIIRWRLSL